MAGGRILHHPSQYKKDNDLLLLQLPLSVCFCFMKTEKCRRDPMTVGDAATCRITLRQINNAHDSRTRGMYITRASNDSRANLEVRTWFANPASTRSAFTIVSKLSGTKSHLMFQAFGQFHPPPSLLLGSRFRDNRGSRLRS